MTKFFLAAAVLTAGFATTAMAQDDNYEMAKMGITMNGHLCERVLSAEPTDDDDVIEITCVLRAGSDSTGVYIFTINGAGFTVDPK